MRLHEITLAWPGNLQLEIWCADSEPGETIEHGLEIDGFQSAQLDTVPDSGLATAPLCYSQDPEGFYESLQFRENTDYRFAVTLPRSYGDIAAKWPQTKREHSSWPFANPRLAPIVELDPPRMWQRREHEGREAVTVFGRLNFGSFVGTVDLALDPTRPIKVEVACSKITYFEDFKSLLRDISEDIVELLFEIDSVAGFRFEAEEPRNVPPSVVLFHLRRLMAPDALPLAVETIIRNPYTRLAESTILSDASRAAKLDVAHVAQLASRLPYQEGGSLAGLFFGSSPLILPETIKRDLLDTLENRYVKDFLQRLSNTCHWLESMLRQEGKTASLREVHQWELVVDEWLSWESWKEVGELTYVPSNSQVLFRRSGYRDVLEASLSLQYALRLPWQRGLEIASALGDIRPVYELYEYWCYFVLRKALRHICGPETIKPNGLYVEDEHGLQVSLRRGKTSRIDFVYSNGSQLATITLFYNRTFQRSELLRTGQDGSYSSTFHPDFSVLITANRLRHWLHFDAKYRLDYRQWQREISAQTVEEIEQELIDRTNLAPTDMTHSTTGRTEALDVVGREDIEVYAKSDLYKMHTYRDALWGSRGAYILFPGSGSDSTIFIRHPDVAYRGKYNIPSVGAFPLRPILEKSQLTGVVTFLADILSHLLDADSRYQDELGLLLPEA